LLAEAVEGRGACRGQFAKLGSAGSARVGLIGGLTGTRWADWEYGSLRAPIVPRNHRLHSDVNSRSRGAMRPSFASIATP
jgi:hypothetical protein